MRKSISKSTGYDNLNISIYTIFVALYIFCSNIYSQVSIQTNGKVIDGNKKPVAEAHILLFPIECKECTLDAIETFVSNEDGFFTARLLTKTKYYLFIEEEIPSTYWSAINFPSGTIRYLPRYRGKYVFFPYSPRKSIAGWQNLRPTIEYIKTEIDLEKFIFKTHKGKIDTSKIKIQTKDYNGRVITDKRGVEEKYWIDSSKIKLVLPKGTWILDLFVVDNGNEKKFGSIRIQLEQPSDVKQFYK